MRVNIDEIKEGGLDRAWDFSREQLDQMLAGDPAGHRASAPAHVTAHLDKVSRRVLLRARSRAQLGAPCGRCLAPAAVEVPVDFSLTLVPEEEGAEPAPEPAGDRHRHRGGGSFSTAEADEETYSGKEIDLDPFVREQILLALPASPLCREGCRGLCPACGQNLNERECGCDRRVPDPRWAGLEKFRAGTK
jgi:uncharacterized protein